MGGALYQHSTIGALNNGFFEGSLPVGELLKKGDLGIGTLDGMQGELVVLDGKPYVVLADGQVKVVPPEVKTPYAAVTFFEAEKVLPIKQAISRDRLKTVVEDFFRSKNAFQAVRFHGHFDYMKCRAVAKQEEPYKRLVDVSAEQSEFYREDVTGTVIGIYTPEKFDVVSAPGFHVHFLSDDLSFGGHILDYKALEGDYAVQTIEDVSIHFPLNNPRFMIEEIDYERLSEELNQAES